MKRLAKTLVAGFAALSLGALIVPVHAQAQKKKKAGKSSSDKRVKTYDFTGDEIDGDLIKPDGEFLDTRKFASHTSLISIRKDFIREIVKSAEDL